MSPYASPQGITSHAVRQSHTLTSSFVGRTEPCTLLTYLYSPEIIGIPSCCHSLCCGRYAYRNASPLTYNSLSNVRPGMDVAFWRVQQARWVLGSMLKETADEDLMFCVSFSVADRSHHPADADWCCECTDACYRKVQHVWAKSC